MPARHVGHVDEDVAGDERGERAPQEIVEDQPAGGRGLYLPGSDGIARVDDDHGQAARREFLGHALGEELGALIVADHVLEGHRRGLGSQASIAGKADGAEARGIDHATDASVRAGLEDGAGAVHIVAVDLTGILRPQPIVRRDVEDEAAAGEGGGEGLRVEDVAAEDLDAATGERLEAARRPREDAHAVAVGDEQPRHVGSHEAGGAGDVPGLNSVIKSVVYRSAELGYTVVGLRRGWEALTHVDLQDPASRTRYVLPLTRENTRTIDRTGGTYLHTSRTNPSRMIKLPPVLNGQEFPAATTPTGGVTYDVTRAVQKNVETLGLDHLIAIGGDDTVSYAAELSRRGTPVMAVPKTMDNDVRDTEYCIGFSTAVTRAIDAIERQRTTVGSHERIGIFRVFGRDAGHTALYTAYVTSMRCCIPEHHVSLPKLIELLLADKRNNPSNYSIVVLSEGAEWEGYTVKEYGEPDAFGHRRKMSVAEDLSTEIKAATGEDTVVSDLTYELRSGTPDFLDRMIAITFAGMAMDAIQEGKQGLMTAVSHGRFALKPIPDPSLGPRRVDVTTMYNVERYRPTYVRKLGLPIFLTRA